MMPARRRVHKVIVTVLLQRPEGATLGEIMKATGWQKHSCHGAISTLNAKSVAGAEGERRYHL
jgi:DNA-binding IclR family transcriptional regulator